MDETRNEFTPRARAAGLIVREIAGELLVYDRDRNKAHSLNQTAALIWKHCDGQTTVAHLRSRLQEQMPEVAINDEVIWHALDQFSRDHLLDEKATRSPGVRRLSRRELIQRIGLAASVPLVVSIVAPSVFGAASCAQACSLPIDCTVPGCPVCSGAGGTCHA